MVKVLYGAKGTGKTKKIIDSANEMLKSSSGDVVFIDYDNGNMYNIKHEIRFINASDFNLSNSQKFLGFLCGIVSENYDISGIFIDGLSCLLNEKIEDMESFFVELDKVAAQYKIEFLVGVNCLNSTVPEYLKKYTA